MTICQESGCEKITSFGLHGKCAGENCTKYASFNFPGEKRPIYCKIHSKPLMQNTSGKHCIYVDIGSNKKCTKRAAFNIIGEKRGLYCFNHSNKTTMTNVLRKRCGNPGCTKSASFNAPGEKIGLYCLKHITDPLMTVVSVNRCKFSGCTKRPSFNIPGETSKLYCKTHADITMDYKGKAKCIIIDCPKLAYYNFELEKDPIYCKTHADLTMVHKLNRRCKGINCAVSPSFNIVGSKIPLYCNSCKMPDMINVMKKRCSIDGCIKSGYFHIPGNKKIRFCRKHSTNEMCRIAKKCEFDKCDKNPSFNYDGKKNARFCEDHALSGMRNTISQRCISKECEKLASYCNPTEKKSVFCFDHKNSDSVRNNSKNCQKCVNLAIYGIEGKRKQYCFKHKEDNHVNLFLIKKCSIPLCESDFEFIENGINYCSIHKPTQNEDILKKKCKYCELAKTDIVCSECKQILHKKELCVIRQIRKRIETPFIHDSSIMLQGCAKRRPDAFFDSPMQCIIVEIDEHQHRNYDENCECTRMNEIVNGIGGRPVTFIRFNTDTIKNKGQIIEFSLEERVELLIKVINIELNKIPDKVGVHLIQLYFDDNNEEYQSIKEEDITDKIMV